MTVQTPTRIAEESVIIVVDEYSQLPLRGNIHRWVRDRSPWHRDAFRGLSKEIQDAAPDQSPQHTTGWMAEDWCGNPLEFVADGTSFSINKGDELQVVMSPRPN